MRTLDRKLVRDLVRQRGQALAAAVLIGCATAVFVGAMSTQRSLLLTQEAYYAEHGFGDLFVDLQRAPLTLLGRVRAIPGVQAADGRIAADAALTLAGFDEPVKGHLVSLAPDGGRLGRLHLISGRMLSPERPGEVLVSEGFAKAHGLGPGARLHALINGRDRELTVVGVALSPEHIYVIRPGDIVPDDLHYGVVWIGREALSSSLDMTGAFNSLVVRLMPGAPKAPVRAALDLLLAPYGSGLAYERDRHSSHRFVADEIGQLQAMATGIPVIFLAVAAFLLSVILSRLVGTQRQQIGTMKALGYTSAAVGLHYLSFAVVIALLGTALGLGGGLLMGKSLASIYAELFRFPRLVYVIEPHVALIALVLSLSAAALGAAGAVRRAVGLTPAEAMRAEAPASFEPSVLERFGIARAVSAQGRITIRNLARRPWRAALTSLGIAAAVALIVAGAFFRDALALIVDHQLRRSLRADAVVTFTQALPEHVALEVRRLPGVLASEPFRAAAIRLRAGARTFRTGLVGQGAPANGLPRQNRLLDRDGAPVALPARGLLLSRFLADALAVRKGDPVSIEFLEGRRRETIARVAGVTDDLLGVQATMSLSEANRLLREGPFISGVYLSVDAGEERALYTRLRGLPKIAGVTLKRAAIASFENTLAEHIVFFAMVIVGFAVAIAVGVVYNTARISFTQRQRELATLRVIGFSRAEAWGVLVGELLVQVAIALPVGCVLGWVFAYASCEFLSSELFRIPVVITPATYIFACLVVAASSGLVAVMARRWVAALDLVEALKTRE